MGKHRTYAVKANFMDDGFQEHTIIALPQSFLALQDGPECKQVFELTRFDAFFKLPPCQVDPRRCYELLDTLKDDNTCTVIDKEGEKMEVLITHRNHRQSTPFD